MTKEKVEFYIQVFDPGLAPGQIENLAMTLGHEITQKVGKVEAEKHPQKDVDPLALGVLSLTLTTTLLPKFLDFLHAWLMRRENRHVKVKLQADDKSVEIEVPQTSSPEEIEKWMELAERTLHSNESKNKKKRV